MKPDVQPSFRFGVSGPKSFQFSQLSRDHTLRTMALEHPPKHPDTMKPDFILWLEMKK